MVVSTEGKVCFHTKTRADGLSAGSTMKEHWKLGRVSTVALSELAPFLTQESQGTCVAAKRMPMKA